MGEVFNSTSYSWLSIEKFEISEAIFKCLFFSLIHNFPKRLEEKMNAMTNKRIGHTYKHILMGSLLFGVMELQFRVSGNSDSAKKLDFLVIYVVNWHFSRHPYR